MIPYSCGDTQFVRIGGNDYSPVIDLSCVVFKAFDIIGALRVTPCVSSIMCAQNIFPSYCTCENTLFRFALWQRKQRLFGCNRLARG